MVVPGGNDAALQSLPVLPAPTRWSRVLSFWFGKVSPSTKGGVILPTWSTMQRLPSHSFGARILPCASVICQRMPEVDSVIQSASSVVIIPMFKHGSAQSSKIWRHLDD